MEKKAAEEESYGNLTSNKNRRREEVTIETKKIEA